MLDVRDALHVVTGRAATGSAARTTTPSPRCWAYATADDLLTMVSFAAGAPWPMRSTPRCGAPARASARAPCASARAGPPGRPRLWRLRARRRGRAGRAYAPSADVTLPMRAAVVAARAGLALSPQTLANLAEVGDPCRPRGPTPGAGICSPTCSQREPGLVGGVGGTYPGRPGRRAGCRSGARSTRGRSATRSTGIRSIGT
jgi:[protein-PII] uridylyltransferase